MKADSGKSIPLVPGTSTPHKCPEKEVVPPPEQSPQENLKKILDKEAKVDPEQAHVTMEGKSEPPPHREFNEEVTKSEVKRISVWARFQANSINFPEDFDKNKATTDELRARQIDRNVDKKDLMHYYFYVKYSQKKDSVDNVP